MTKADPHHPSEVARDRLPPRPAAPPPPPAVTLPPAIALPPAATLPPVPGSSAAWARPLIPAPTPGAPVMPPTPAPGIPTATAVPMPGIPLATVHPNSIHPNSVNPNLAATQPNARAAPTATPGPLGIDSDAAGEAPPDVSEQAARSAPPWLVSLVVHSALLIVLALITVHQKHSNQLQLEATYAETLGEQLIDDSLQTAASLELVVDAPALSFDRLPADDPFAAPPMLPAEFRSGTQAISNLEAPSIGLALTGREAGMKKALLGAYGGNETTESAVRAGLEWLKKNQMRDGGWSLAGPYPDGTYTENRVAATAMALLAFQGAGITDRTGDFQNEVKRGWNYLLRLQNLDGFFTAPETGHNQMLYAQAQATIAICELYGMTKDEKYKRPAQLALQFAQKAQSPELGGWRYQPREDSDLSVTGWFVMGFQSGRMAGLDVHSDMLDRVSQFLDRCATREDGGARYAYQPGNEAKLSMTAEGLLCRQYLGWKHNDERLRRGVELLLRNPVNYQEQNVYYWYYATQVCHHMGGADWSRWNQVMRQEIPSAQVKTGNNRGSWAPQNDDRGSSGGRLYVTCLSIYMLEVYYRHMPIYQLQVQ